MIEYQTLQTQLRNYLETLKISPYSCAGFEEEALGACMGLVHYLSMTPQQQVAWLTAVYNAAQNTSGTLQAGPANKSFFYHAVLSRKKVAFGMDFRPWDLERIDPVDCPWALPEPVFRALDREVIQGRGLAGRKQIQWSDVVDGIAGWTKDHGGATPIAGLGLLAIRSLIKKYAPRLAAVVFGEWTLPVLAAVGFTAILFENWAIRLNNAEAASNFAVDRRRRDYDLTLSARKVA